MKLSLYFAGIATIAILSLGNAASAQFDIYNNINVPSAGVDQLAQNGPLANSFSTGSTSVDLSQVTLELSATNPLDGGSFTVLLGSGNSEPNSAVATLGTANDSALSASLSDYSFSPSSTVVLAANTRYWIGIEGSSSVEWSYASTNDGIGTAGEYWFWNPGGYGTGGTSVLNGTVVSGIAQTPFNMEVTVTPEPGSIALIASLCLTGAGFLARRRTR